MAKFDPGSEGYPIWQTGLPTLAGHPTYHVNVIKLKWEIIWTGGLPHISGLPHVPGVPHLHINRFLFSQFRPRDILQAIAYAYICTWMHVRKTTFERNSSLGYHHVIWSWKQKIQTKEVFFLLEKWFCKILLANQGALWSRWKWWIVKWMFTTFLPVDELKKKCTQEKTSQTGNQYVTCLQTLYFLLEIIKNSYENKNRKRGFYWPQAWWRIFQKKRKNRTSVDRLL